MKNCKFELEKLKNYFVSFVKKFNCAIIDKIKCNFC